VHFFRGSSAFPSSAKRQRTANYQNWVEAFACNHDIPIKWAEKGVRKEDYVQPWLRKMVRKNAFGVYFVFKSMQQGRTFRVTVPKFPTKDPNHRILAPQKSRFKHNCFYIRNEVLGPMVMRVATFFPFQTTYCLNGQPTQLTQAQGARLLERDGSRHAYRLTTKGAEVALPFLFFHKRLCGPLANSRFHHQPNAEHRPNSRLGAAHHRADTAIQNSSILRAAA
jgi:hypothetical protein